MDTPRIELTVADRLAIRELVDRYNDAINHRNWVGLAGLFAPDATWEVAAPLNLRFESSAKIAGGLRWMIGRMELLVQVSSAVVITALEPDRALVRSTMIEFSRQRPGGAGMRSTGTHHDEVQRTAGTWYFKHRTFRTRYLDHAPLPGEVHENCAPDLGGDGTDRSGLDHKPA